MYHPDKKPGKSGGWSSTLKLKTQQTVPAGVFQAYFPKSEYYTVQFGIVQPPALPASLGIYSAIAEITWKVEGNSVVRQVSVGNGVSISGTGESLNVKVIDNTPNYGQPAGFDYQIGVQVSPGTRPSQSQPPTLLNQAEVSVLAPNTTIEVPVPVGAGVISVELAAASFVVATGLQAVNEIIVSFLSTGGAPVKTINLTSQYDGFIPVPPGTVNLLVTNQSLLNDTEFAVTWGIDG